ncbi:uncharacterized protein LOC128956764 [Oppia nitens]|uniref:uncharacterized protein LOC128956764 n=1 Tax=Oppia nitens TaxID=1686743 RepID=UPI0023DCA326|nr:uncharacterized protein LOC128956764 [Oppia nitens]
MAPIMLLSSSLATVIIILLTAIDIHCVKQQQQQPQPQPQQHPCPCLATNGSVSNHPTVITSEECAKYDGIYYSQIHHKYRCQCCILYKKLNESCKPTDHHNKQLVVRCDTGLQCTVGHQQVCIEKPHVEILLNESLMKPRNGKTFRERLNQMIRSMFVCDCGQIKCNDEITQQECQEFRGLFVDKLSQTQGCQCCDSCIISRGQYEKCGNLINRNIQFNCDTGLVCHPYKRVCVDKSELYPSKSQGIVKAMGWGDSGGLEGDDRERVQGLKQRQQQQSLIDSQDKYDNMDDDVVNDKYGYNGNDGIGAAVGVDDMYSGDRRRPLLRRRKRDDSSAAAAVSESSDNVQQENGHSTDETSAAAAADEHLSTTEAGDVVLKEAQSSDTSEAAVAAAAGVGGDGDVALKEPAPVDEATEPDAILMATDPSRKSWDTRHSVHQSLAAFIKAWKEDIVKGAKQLSHELETIARTEAPASDDKRKNIPK